MTNDQGPITNEIILINWDLGHWSLIGHWELRIWSFID